MRRVPIVATILVALAVAAMISLGVWQLQRRQEKEALLVRLAQNRDLPPIAFPRAGGGDTLLFRRASARCAVAEVSSEGGHDAAGKPGWRQIATCGFAPEPGKAGAVCGPPPPGPRFKAQIGVAYAPNVRPTWSCGMVSGYISYAPDHQPLIAQIFTSAPKQLMIVADPPLAGLGANPAADLSSVPNNHLAYAVQWFLFAAIAAIIYGIALVRRGKAGGAAIAEPGPPR